MLAITSPMLKPFLHPVNAANPIRRSLPSRRTSGAAGGGALRVQVEDLAGVCGEGYASLDLYETSRLPDQPPDPLGAGPPTDGREKGLRHRVGIERAEPWMNDEAQPRSPVGVLGLDELVVGRRRS